MEMVTMIGYAASLCSVASFVPQALKIARSQETAAISTRMYLLTVTGFALWTLFGLLRNELPIILATGYADFPNAHMQNLPRLSKPFGSHELRLILTTLNRQPLAS